MPSSRPARRSLTYEEFMERVSGDLDQPFVWPSTGLPPQMPSNLRKKYLHAELNTLREIRALRLARKHDSPDAFVSLLRWFLKNHLNLEPPAGVFIPHLKGTAGRKER